MEDNVIKVYKVDQNGDLEMHLVRFELSFSTRSTSIYIDSYKPVKKNYSQYYYHFIAHIFGGTVDEMMMTLKYKYNAPILIDCIMELCYLILDIKSSL